MYFIIEFHYTMLYCIILTMLYCITLNCVSQDYTVFHYNGLFSFIFNCSVALFQVLCLLPYCMAMLELQSAALFTVDCNICCNVLHRATLCTLHYATIIQHHGTPYCTILHHTTLHHTIIIYCCMTV